HALAHLLDRAAEPARARLDRAHTLGLAAERRDVFGDPFELRHQAIGLGVDVGDLAARLLQLLEATFHRREAAAEIDNALADRVEPLILELEPLHGALHVVAPRREPGAQFTVRLPHGGVVGRA